MAQPQTGRGWMPDVDQVPSPNIAEGRAGQTIQAGVIHIMDGSYSGSIEWLTGDESGTSAHFAVSDDGDITQMVNLFDTAFGNGLKWDKKRSCWLDPDGNVVTPAWPLLSPPVNPNYQTFSIEHEGRRGKVWTPAMYEADRRILLYVQSQTPIVYIPHRTLIGHSELSPLLRPFCPGPGVELGRIAASVTAGLTIRHAPRITLATWTGVLQRFGSPVAPLAGELWDIVVKSGIDPAIALAFFGKESTFGTQGISAEIKNWGNVRFPYIQGRSIGMHPRSFAIYADWQTALLDWCDRMNGRYIDERGLDTVEKAVPVYAPATDGNLVDDYIRFVVGHVHEWEAKGTSDVRQYRVLRDSNIRQSPEVKTGNIAGTAPKGQTFPGRVVPGGAPPGSTDTRWVHRVEDQLGFMHMSVLEELPA